MYNSKPVFPLLALLLIISSLTAAAQAPGERWAPAQLINKRTGEALKVKCFDSDPSSCNQFQYFQVDAQGNETPLTRMLDAHAVETALSERAPRSENIFTSKKPLYLIQSPKGDTNITFFPGKGGEFNDTLFGEVTEKFYKHSNYESNVGYAAKVTAVSATVTPMTFSFSLIPTAAVTAAELVMLPIRGLGKVVLAIAPNHAVKGAQRVVYKQALDSAETLIDRSGNVYTSTAKWKRIRDRLSDLK
jgi:hypothetical protein